MENPVWNTEKYKEKETQRGKYDIAKNQRKKLFQRIK
jgi:hypothetical protein